MTPKPPYPYTECASCAYRKGLCDGRKQANESGNCGAFRHKASPADWKEKGMINVTGR